MSVDLYYVCVYVYNLYVLNVISVTK